MSRYDGACLHASGCLQPARKKHLCEQHMWEGDEWTRETVEAADGTTFTYIRLKVLPVPSYVDEDDLVRAASEPSLEPAERTDKKRKGKP